jgi:hypothetical protein
MLGALFEVQATPTFVEVKMPLLLTATSLVPSADETMDTQLLGEAVSVHVSPESVEIKMFPELVGVLACAAAASTVPSAEEATLVQKLLGALVCVQVWAKTQLTIIKMAGTGSNVLKIFIGRLFDFYQSPKLSNIYQVQNQSRLAEPKLFA